MRSLSTQLLVESRSTEAAGDIAAALQRAASALEEARADGDQELIASALCRVATIHWRIGHFADAQGLATEAAANVAATTSRVDALIIAGASAAARDEIIAGEDYLHQATDLSRELSYPAGLSLALQYLASQVYLRRGQFDLALTTAAEAVRLGPPDRRRRLSARHFMSVAAGPQLLLLICMVFISVLKPWKKAPHPK